MIVDERNAGDVKDEVEVGDGIDAFEVDEKEDGCEDVNVDEEAVVGPIVVE